MLKKLSFKSRLERQFALLLNQIGINFGYEEDKIPYTLECNYLPDFKIGNFYVETKGRFTSQDRRKHLAVKKDNPSVDIRFVFMRDERINKTSKTRYSDWCKKHGYKYSIGVGIPQSWLDEAKEFTNSGDNSNGTKRKQRSLVRKNSK